MLHGELVAESIRSGLRLPAVSSAFDYCNALDVYVDVDPQPLPGQCAGANYAKLCAIWIGRESNERRQNFSAAHELGHLHLDPGLCYRMGEATADRFAAALLMPAWEFIESVRELRMDLHALHRLWRFSSMGAIGGRIGELLPASTATAWRELQPMWSRSSADEPLDSKFAALELEALGDVYHRPRGAVEIRRGPRIVRAWRTHAMQPRRAISVCQSD